MSSVVINTADHRVRLHITPFNPELLDRIIAPSLRPQTSRISFHTVPTFPERGFGYVELPAMEAQKLKKKLNGSTLRGAKVRIEEAKPERKRKSDESEDGEEGKVAKKARKNQKRQEGVVAGHELEEGRRVKRGWTEDSVGGKSSKKKKKGKAQETSEEADNGLEGKKLRFKTAIPPNATEVETNRKDQSKAKSKESKKEAKQKKKVVVQEFAKSTAPSAKAAADESATRAAVSYEEGIGWVNEDGNVVEAERKSRRTRTGKSTQEPERRTSAIESREVPDETPIVQQIDNAADTSLDNDNDDGNMDAAEEPSPSTQIHPLEALFKRPTSSSTASPRKRPVPINTTFSFFDASASADADAASETGADMPPQTPHTKRDLEWRSIRSAAPTPDTAALGRHFSFPFAEDEDEDEGEGEEGDGIQQERRGDVEMEDAGAGAGGAEESAFRKWFYENRGDLNRGWKKRRREEKKVRRQRENRRVGRRVA